MTIPFLAIAVLATMSVRMAYEGIKMQEYFITLLFFVVFLVCVYACFFEIC